jgi:NAD(P)-dependent dehydrogenase (short-subunit alcohol dehydrogenase family)
MKPLREQIAVVTGASRGGGRGIARVLGSHGATVYVTGRTSRGGTSPTGRTETIEDTADEVTAAGGHGIPAVVDHTDADQVRAFFERVRDEQGRLDLLVSNAWGGYEMEVGGQPFWELDPAHLDLMLTAGLRSHILTIQLAAPLLNDTRDGLVVFTTWAIRDDYHGQLYYDVVKTAINRIPVGVAHHMGEHGVTAIAVSPGWMHTESMDLTPERADQTESVEFVGRAVAALASDADVKRHTGELLTVVELAKEYGFTDVNGRSSSPFWDRKGWLPEHWVESS